MHSRQFIYVTRNSNFDHKTANQQLYYKTYSNPQASTQQSNSQASTQQSNSQASTQQSNSKASTQQSNPQASTRQSNPQASTRQSKSHSPTKLSFSANILDNVQLTSQTSIDTIHANESTVTISQNSCQLNASASQQSSQLIFNSKSHSNLNFSNSTSIHSANDQLSKFDFQFSTSRQLNQNLLDYSTKFYKQSRNDKSNTMINNLIWHTYSNVIKSIHLISNILLEKYISDLCNLALKQLIYRIFPYNPGINTN